MAPRGRRKTVAPQRVGWKKGQINDWKFRLRDFWSSAARNGERRESKVVYRRLPRHLEHSGRRNGRSGRDSDARIALAAAGTVKKRCSANASV